MAGVTEEGILRTKSTSAVGGGLTDIELRLNPINVTLTNPGLTNAELRALPIPISGTALVNVGLTDTQLRAAPIVITGNISTEEARASISIISSVASSITSVTILSASVTRLMAMIFNESTSILYLKFGATASLTSYSVQIPPGGYYELPHPTFTGLLTGIWSSVNGSARITELS